MRLNDTIAAISSAVGAAPRIIVRVSGCDSESILTTLCPDCPPAPCAARVILRFNGLRVPAWVYRFTFGKSYTGEALIELHIPGNPLLAKLLLQQLIASGARQAEAGEFTARAFFNGRLDLSQAEGIAAVIGAASSEELAVGRKLLAGELSRRLRPLMDELAQTLALVEAEIDFSDSEIRFTSGEEVYRRAALVGAELSELLRQSSRFARLSHEPKIALVGRPNAGKSTLLNALSKSARAIVSPIAGTTRDALCATVALQRGLIQLVDMAGVEEQPQQSEIESQMQRRAMEELERADAVVLVRDASDDRPPLELSCRVCLTLRTKIDLRPIRVGNKELAVSAVAGTAMEQLRAALDTIAFGGPAGGGAAELALTARHVESIETAAAALGRVSASRGAELTAAELRGALDALGQVLGEVSPDDILGRVFSTFCIGK